MNDIITILNYLTVFITGLIISNLIKKIRIEKKEIKVNKVNEKYRKKNKPKTVDTVLKHRYALQLQDLMEKENGEKWKEILNGKSIN